MTPQKKKVIAFKSTPTISNDDDEEKDDEELSLLVKNVRRMYNNQVWKKALKGTWDSESETDDELDTAYVCFMANDNTPKVTFEPSLDDNELTMNELGEAFEELSNNYDFLKKKYLKIKKKNETLQNKIVILSNEMIYLPHSYPHKKISMHKKFHVKQNFH